MTAYTYQPITIRAWKGPSILCYPNKSLFMMVVEGSRKNNRVEARVLAITLCDSSVHSPFMV